MIAADLPNRRSEAWKYSDLRAAFGDARPSMAGEGDVIERLAAAAGGTDARTVAPGKSDVFVNFLDEDGFQPSAETIKVGADGTYHRIVIQTAAGLPLSFCRVRLGAGATFRQFVLAEGAKLARIETHVSIEGEGAQVELNGLYMCDAGRHADLTSVIEHKAGAGQTRQLIKGVARKGGRGVFQGKIVVERGAQKTDARQYHHGMLLEDGAEIFAKPELLIHADDVQCAHGNTAGGLDETALFYMRSRGVPESQARALLIEAFLSETIPEWAAPDVRDEIETRIRTWLGGAA
ncbi:MAG: SufD family Fe-S cluster assembly protein [Vitreimonas sp.]